MLCIHFFPSYKRGWIGKLSKLPGGARMGTIHPAEVLAVDERVADGGDCAEVEPVGLLAGTYENNLILSEWMAVLYLEWGFGDETRSLEIVDVP